MRLSNEYFSPTYRWGPPTQKTLTCIYDRLDGHSRMHTMSNPRISTLNRPAPTIVGRKISLNVRPNFMAFIWMVYE